MQGYLLGSLQIIPEVQHRPAGQFRFSSHSVIGRSNPPSIFFNSCLFNFFILILFKLLICLKDKFNNISRKKDIICKKYPVPRIDVRMIFLHSRLCKGFYKKNECRRFLYSTHLQKLMYMKKNYSFIFQLA